MKTRGIYITKECDNLSGLGEEGLADCSPKNAERTIENDAV